MARLNKKCKKCGIEREITEFAFRKDREQYVARCKKCISFYSKLKYKPVKRASLYSKNELKERQKQQQKKYRATKKGKLTTKVNNIKFKKQNPDYAKKWCYKNKEASKEKNMLWYQENKERKLSIGKIWEKNNKTRRKIITKNLKEKHPERYVAYTANYRAKKLKATPPWANLETILEVYQMCADTQWLSEEPLEVDHIISFKVKMFVAYI